MQVQRPVHAAAAGFFRTLLGLAVLQAGAQDFLGKGASPALLLKTLRYALERNRAELLRVRLVHADRLSAVGQLAASIAHEVNNPNAYVLANLTLLAQELDDDSLDKGEARELLTESIEGVNRVTKIVRQLSTFARVDTDVIEEVNLAEVVHDAVALTANELRHCGQLTLEMEPDLPSLHGSPTRLVQVVTNALVNAAHALSEVDQTDERFILVKAAKMDEEWVEVQVLDTGCGIPESNRSLVTQPFFTTKPMGLGTGLGLAICKEIVERHYGHLEVGNRSDGRGVCFRMALPLRTAPRAAVPSRVAVPEFDPSDYRSLHVLLVDDEPALLRAFGRLFERAGHVLTRVGSASDALHVLEQGDVAFDGVLCDLMMPSMDGVTLYERICQIQPGLAKRTVFCTGGAFTSRARHFLTTTDVLVLHKPLEVPELEKAFRLWASSPLSAISSQPSKA